MSRVSVLMPVRNGRPHLAAAIDSILTQTFDDLELIIVDDGSSDGSGELARAKVDPRVTVVRTGGVGVAAALNAGLAIARGEFIARQDADDLSAPARIAMQVAHLDRHPDVSVVASRVAFIDDHGAPISTAWTRAVCEQWEAAMSPDDIATLMPTTCCIVHGSVMMRAAALRACHGYDAALPVAQDYDLWLRLLPAARFARLPDRLYSFRLHGQQISAHKGREQARQSVAAKLRYLARITATTPSTATILGYGAGADLYRSAIADAGWTESPRAEPPELTVFTDFSTLDRDMQAAIARSSRELTRIGNFLLDAGARM